MNKIGWHKATTGKLILAVLFLSAVAANNSIADQLNDKMSWKDPHFESPTDRRLVLHENRKKSIIEDFTVKFKRVRSRLHHQEIIAAIRKSNSERNEISNSEVQELEMKWISSGNQLADKISSSSCSLFLKDFQRGDEELYPEIFVTNSLGLNVCQTNKTTDYYQADEKWWRIAKQGQVTYSRISYDESAKAMALATHIPIVDPVSKEVIGAAKALLRADKKLR